MSAVEFTPEQLDQAADRFVRSLHTPRAEAMQVAESIASAHGLTVQVLLSPSRFRHVVLARVDPYRALRAPEDRMRKAMARKAAWCAA